MGFNLLPTDILQEILEHLSFKDLVRLSVVCKTWRPVFVDVIQHHPIMNMPKIIGYASDSYDTLYVGEIFSRFLDHPLEFRANRACTLDKTLIGKEVTQLRSAYICASKYGWMLLFASFSGALFFYNIFLNKTIKVPSFRIDRADRVTFTAPPTSPDCTIFVVMTERRGSSHGGVDGTVINTISCNLKAGRWTTMRTTETPRAIHIGDVVYIDGNLHCLFHDVKNSKLASPTFNVALEEWFDMHHSYRFTIEDGSSSCLVESTDGELLLIIIYHEEHNTHLYVYSFDRDMKFWRKVKSLGKNAIFLTGLEDRIPCLRWSATVVPTVGELARKFANKVYTFRTGSRSCWSHTSVDLEYCGSNIWIHHDTYSLGKLQCSRYIWI